MNNSKNKYENLLKNYNKEFEYKVSPEDILINSIDNKIIDNINNIYDLKELEIHVDKLLTKVRCKLGNEENDPIMNKMVEKYSKLILEKINKNE